VSAYEQVKDIIEIILCAVAEEAKRTQDALSVEVESVIIHGVLEAFKRGENFVYNRDTLPPPRVKTLPYVPAIKEENKEIEIIEIEEDKD
jgi:hypothetical protein